MKRVYFAVRVPEFPAQALLRLRQQLMHLPVAVLAGTAPLQQVCSVNKRAKDIGVQPGMTRAQLDVFDGLHLLPQSIGEEASARQALLDAALVFTPRVQIMPQANHALALVMDMTGTRSLWGSVERAIRRVAKVFRDMHFTARFAVSSNMDASVCLAAVPQREPVVVPAGGERRALAPLPLSALQMQPEMEAILNLWGLHSVGDLAALPLHAVTARLGKEGADLHAAASGTRDGLLVPEESVLRLEESLTFDAPVELLDSLLFVLNPMLDQLIRRAANHSYALASLAIGLILEGGGKHSRTIRPAIPSCDKQALLKLVHLDLQGYPPGGGVIEVCVTAEPGDRMPVQSGLFFPQLPEPMHLDVTLARMIAMLGEENVGQIKLLDTHRESDSKQTPFTIHKASGEKKQQATKPQKIRATIRRCRPPVQLRVYAQRKENAQRPLSFYWNGTLYVVMDALGPWRKSGDWWSSDVWSHEDWDVHATAGDGVAQARLLCVLRHDLLRKLWTLQGLYD